MAVKKKADVGVKENALLAIVLSDVYEDKFHPLTLEEPRCLLPLANTPLIEYTLEFLATTGVTEVYITCCNHAEKVEAYINQSKWKRSSSPFQVHIMSLPESRSVGDVMRHVDSKGFVKNDFVLISGDVVCNLDFSKVLQSHKDRKNKDRNTIMTMVLREASAFHRTRARRTPGVFLLDAETNRCLRYRTDAGCVSHSLSPRKSKNSSKRLTGVNRLVEVDAELLGEVENGIAFRNDLIDCRIDICTVDVPALFTENFDYDELRQDFVRGIVMSELLGKNIYAYIEKERYGARVQSFQTYDAISKDIIARYTYPVSPESNMMEDQTYSFYRGNVYKESHGVVLAQSSVVNNSAVIGSNTRIGEGTTVRHSTIGRNCVIGNNVVIDGSYIWDNVVIEDGVHVTRSVVARNVKLGEGTIVHPGSILSFGVQVAKNMSVPANVRLVSRSYSDDEEQDSDFEDIECPEIVGSDGVGYVFIENDSSDSDESSSEEEDAAVPASGSPEHVYRSGVDGLVYDMHHLDVSDVSDAEDAAISGTASGASVSRTRSKRRHNRSMSMASATTAGSDQDNEEDDFFLEAVATVERSLREGHTQETSLLELNTLRMTMNVTHHEYRRAVIHALVHHIARLVSSETQILKSAAAEIFNQWQTVLNRIVFEPSDEVDLLIHLQRECVKEDAALKPPATKLGAELLFYGVYTLYYADVVDYDSIFLWWDNPASTATAEMQQIRSATSRWIEYLKENPEDDDEESEEEDDDDEDSDDN